MTVLQRNKSEQLLLWIVLRLTKPIIPVIIKLERFLN